MTSIEFGELDNGSVFVDECNHMWRKISDTSAVRVVPTKFGMIENINAGAFDKEDRVHVLT